MPTPNRRAILARLARHELPNVVIQEAWIIGARLRDETIRDRTERAVLLDAETGEQPGGVLTGTADRLQLGSLLRQMVPGRRYVVLHMHPEDTSFSPDDIGLLVAHPAIVAVIAVGADGTWYVGSFAPDRPVPSVRTFYDGYGAAYQATVDQYDFLQPAGRLSRREAARRHSHAIWVQAGPALGLRYDRVAGRRRA